MDLNIKGYLINTIPHKDKDLLLSVLTIDKLEIIYGKNVNTPNSKRKSMLTNFNLYEFEVVKKHDYLFLNNISLIKANLKLFDDYLNLLTTQLLTHYIQKSLDYKFNYDLLEKVLELIDLKVENTLILFLALQEISINEGIRLDLSSCKKCGSKLSIVYFSDYYEGYLCKNCTNKRKSVDFLLEIRKLSNLNFTNYVNIKYDNQVLKYLIIFNLDRLKNNINLNLKTGNLIKDYLTKE